MAVAVHFIGFTGKFLAEAIEEAKAGPIDALIAGGAPPRAILLKGFWPQSEIGVPGGQSLQVGYQCSGERRARSSWSGRPRRCAEAAMDNLYRDKVGLVLVVIFAVVVVTAMVTAALRAKVI